jgi:hypothetical protein
MPRQQPAPVPGHITKRRAMLDQFGPQTGKQLVEHERATRQQGMQVSTLGHPPAMLSDGRHEITVHQGNAAVELRQHPCREQPRHACPQHAGMAPSRVSTHRLPRSTLLASWLAGEERAGDRSDTRGGERVPTVIATRCRPISGDET